MLDMVDDGPHKSKLTCCFRKVNGKTIDKYKQLAVCTYRVTSYGYRQNDFQSNPNNIDRSERGRHTLQ